MTALVKHQRISPILATNLEDLQRLARMCAESGFFQDARQLAQACVKIAAGAEYGVPPIVSMAKVNIIKGRVSISAEIMASSMKHAGYKLKVRFEGDQSCTISVIDPDGTELGESVFSMDDAKRAGLLGGEGWKKYPRNMLYARAVSNAARWFAPEVLTGAITPEELGADEDVAEVMPAPSSRVDIIAPPPALPAPAPEPSPWGMDANETEEDAAEMVEYMTASRKKRAEMETESALATAAYDVAVEARKGDMKEKAREYGLFHETEYLDMMERKETVRSQEATPLEEIPEETAPPEYETEDWKRASKRLHAVMREHFWNKDQIKEWMGVESTKDLDAQTLDATAVILSCLNMEQLKNAWLNFPATVRTTLTPLKDAVKAQLENQHRAADIANVIRAVKESECPHAKLPANIRQLPMEVLQHLAGVLSAVHADAIKSAVQFCEKTAEKGDSEKLRSVARQALNLCDTVTVWKLERLGKQ